MSKSLIIAEKPSVAADLARALAKAPGMTPFKKESDFFENETHVITSAVGHLLEQEMPMKDGKKIGWGFTTLPILPEKFELKPIDKTADRYRAVTRLIKRKDVVDIINACDAGREGELIFRNIIEATGTKKPVSRMWMQSMTNGAILEAFDKLRTDEDMQPLANAAKCRSESDWIVGINSTRALTALNSRHGGFRLTPVGRVQTPTLTILAKREREITTFEPRTYYEVHALFGVAAGEYAGRWLDETFKKDDTDEHLKAERLWDREAAEAIVARCFGKKATVEETTKPTRQVAPLLYDLTSLQREASNRFGFSARRTLQLAQALYEKHKALTYPRTDSRYLPNDYIATVKGTIRGFSDLTASKAGAFPVELRPFCDKILDEDWVRPNRRVFDTSKVSDHFAIIPTGQPPPKSLDEAEQKLYDMVLRRFLAVFFPAAEFDVTTRFSRIGEDVFKSDGKVLREAGWLEVYGKKAVDEQEGEGGGRVLVPVKPKEIADAKTVEMREESTKPPPRYNEATLLSSMEGAGKLVDDDELREAMSERGLGTPATRAAIIEGLIMDKYVERQGRELIVTTKGLDLVEQLSDLGAETLCSPELTGQWEYRLKLMEHRQLDRNSFMRDIRTLAADIVDKSKAYAKAAKERVLPDFVATCPFCGAKTFKNTEEFVACRTEDCKLRVFKNVAGRNLNDDELRTLIEKRLLPTMDGFRSRVGKEFSAGLEIKDDRKVNFLFEKGQSDEINWAEAPVLCECPVCAKQGRKANIHILPIGYVCHTAITEPKKCNAKLPLELCKKRISEDNARKFFTQGKTDVIEGMISKKNRPFSAFLVCKAGDKRILGWEFPPREPKPKTASAKSPGAKFGRQKPAPAEEQP
ncbi:DNA topoisomerase III [Verrucomicrobium sp. BvORR034]|uniref:DNA topoisomerase III n=1 Tax=Verrucomicrobium sp. BvORR034 TaxID=1396418 RepID=UPI000679B35E|nr:DNA topoisomerase III [Verrucomicrobium sp. BvORR034]